MGVAKERSGPCLFSIMLALPDPWQACHTYEWAKETGRKKPKGKFGLYPCNKVDIFSGGPLDVAFLKASVPAVVPTSHVFAIASSFSFLLYL